MARVKDVADHRLDGHSEHVLVLDIDVHEPGAFPGPVILGQEPAAAVGAVIPFDAPGDRAVRYVVPEAEVDPAGLGAADLAIFAGQRVFDARLLEAEIGVDLRTLPADRVEVDRAGTLQAPLGRSRKVADAFAVVFERDDIDDVVDDIIVPVEARFAPCPELMADLGLEFPALRRHKVRIAGIGAVVAKLRLGKEVVEADLADAAAELEADVPILRGTPAEIDAALGPQEASCILVVVDAVEPGNLAAGGDLQVQILREGPARASSSLRSGSR